jgi:2',3'-cyclic-nucleotide 2'-phosphodiesterase (5'-nucleotidase family)
MQGFKLVTPTNVEIRFELYLEAAPITSAAFLEILPFTKTFYHARVSGQEIWIDNMPPLNIIQENASVFTQVGEVVLGPSMPMRSKTKNCFGIYYGDGKGFDACNIFAKVVDEDKEKLFELGNFIWENGSLQLTISKL